MLTCHSWCAGPLSLGIIGPLALSLFLVIHNCCAFGTADLQQRPPLGSAAGAAAGAEAGAEARAEAGAEAGAWIGREARHLPGKRRQSGKPPPSRRRNAAGPVRGSTELLAHQGVFPPILGVSRKHWKQQGRDKQS